VAGVSRDGAGGLCRGRPQTTLNAGIFSAVSGVLNQILWKRDFSCVPNARAGWIAPRTQWMELKIDFGTPKLGLSANKLYPWPFIGCINNLRGPGRTRCTGEKSFSEVYRCKFSKIRSMSRADIPRSEILLAPSGPMAIGLFCFPDLGVLYLRVAGAHFHDTVQADTLAVSDTTQSGSLRDG